MLTAIQLQDIKYGGVEVWFFYIYLIMPLPF